MANLSEKGITFEMASFDGGTANNAIPSWAEVVIAVSDRRKNSKKQIRT
ncbi:MAG: peptidase dimerization domain-containing protein [Firmicutes bacterium]|nr:peptidase dimerization domain-containing protein [Candidatus Colivicinus equi]